jgi:hypothetical protein
VRLEGLGQLKKISGLEAATFRFVAYCLNQLRYCVPPKRRRDVFPLRYELNFHIYDLEVIKSLKG